MNLRNYASMAIFLELLSPLSLAQQNQKPGINAENCAVVLSDVRAGRDISINVKCDIPTERQILSSLLQSKFTSECFFATPARWQKIHPATLVELRSLPRSGDYFAQFDFKFIVYPAEQTEAEKAFIFGDSLLLDDEILSPWMKAHHQRILKLRVSNPGYIMPDHVLQRAQNFDYFAAKDALATAKVRSNIQYEDGSNIETGQLYAFKAEKLVTQTTVFPTPNPYPRISDEVTAYVFRCEAELGMKPQIFVDLCAGLIERTTLIDSFGSKTCKLVGSNNRQRYIFSPSAGTN